MGEGDSAGIACSESYHDIGTLFLFPPARCFFPPARLLSLGRNWSFFLPCEFQPIAALFNLPHAREDHGRDDHRGICRGQRRPRGLVPEVWCVPLDRTLLFNCVASSGICLVSVPSSLTGRRLLLCRLIVLFFLTTHSRPGHPAPLFHVRASNWHRHCDIAGRAAQSTSARRPDAARRARRRRRQEEEQRDEERRRWRWWCRAAGRQWTRPRNAAATRAERS